MDAVQNTQQQNQVSEASVLERIKNLGEQIVETVRNFYINLRARAIFTNDAKEAIRNRYNEKPELAVSSEKFEEVNAEVVNLMNEVFNGQHPGEFLLAISDINERQAVMEKFATKLLEIYGLTDVKFMSGYDSIGLCGYYSFDRKVLFLNKSFLTINDPILLLDAVDTILHESRHALQHAAMHDHNPLGFDRETIVSWIKNMNNYVRNDPAAYREQPVEADAFSSAAYTLHTYFQNNGISA